MPQLRNPKHERFAQELAAGKTATEAYFIASGKSSKRYASELGLKPRIAARVKEILTERETIYRQGTAKAIEATALTETWIIERLMENVERAMQLKAVVDTEGNASGEHRYEGTVANRALELLGKHRGMFKDTFEGSLTLLDPIDRPPRETHDQWIARRAREIVSQGVALGAAARAADRGNNR